MTSENERRFREKLSILNENFLRFLQKAYSKNPDADFSPSMKDYTKHLRALDKMYYVDESANDEAQTVTTSSTSTTTASAAEMTIISSTPSLFISSTVTSSTTTTAIPADAGTGANFLFGIGASKTTAPMTPTTTALTTSAGSPFAFGSTTASPVATTTTASATLPLLFDTQQKTTAPAAVPSSVPAFSFGTAKFPSFGSSAAAGTLFGSTTANTLTTSSQPHVNGGSRKRSAAQSVDDISPYGKRTASSSLTETSSIANAPLFGGAPTMTTKPNTAIDAPFLANSTAFSSTTITATAIPSDAGTGANFLFGIGASKTTAPMTATTTALTTSAGSPFAFGSTTASPVATTTTASATLPLLFDTQQKTTAPAAVPSSVPAFSFGTAKFPSFGSSAAAGTLFGSTTANTLTTTATGDNFLFGIGASKTTAPMTATTTALTTSAGSPFAFGSSASTTASPVATTTTASATLPLLFGTQQKTTAPAAVPSSVPTFSFGTAKFPSFGSSAAGGTLFGSTTANTRTTISSADVSKAGKVTDKGGDSDDEAAEEFVPTGTFKPIVPLPSKVDVKSGEENEEVLFSARCKLFRYDPMDKKNKERGIGELKLLHNKETGRYRCVIRSDDQLCKLFANFPVLATMISRITGQKPNVRTLQCRDFSESSEGIDEVFLLKFRDQTTAEEFANKLEETGKRLGETPKEKEAAEKEPRQ